MQWIGWLGVERIVHTGNVLGVGLGMQSKHSVLSYEKGTQYTTFMMERMSYFEQGLNLTKVACGSRFHQGYLGSHAHLVNVSPSICEKFE
jgi:hypothetical protein